MSYSFIKPKVKPLFTVFTRLWLLFIAFIVLLLVAFDAFVIFRNNILQNDIKDMKAKRVQNDKKTLKMNEDIKLIHSQIAVVEQIHAQNEALKKEIQNNFNQVPDEITLSKVKINKKSLILYGLTPSKDLYNFVLALPLRARYDTSNTIFYLNKKGWYRFISTNKLNEQRYE